MVDYSKFTVKQLKEKLRNRRCRVSGRKADLVRRLEKDDKKGSDTSNVGDVNLCETNNISRNNARSSPTAKEDVPLESLGISLETYCSEYSDQFSDCEMVKQLFEVVQETENA